MKMGLSLRMGAGGALDEYVKALFYAGEKGAWYDPSDFSTMWQDSAGTIPVTAAGQVVGKILDKSGNGRHMLQAGVSTIRPVLTLDSNNKYHLLFDGIDDYMSCASFDMSASDKVTIFTSMAKLSDALAGTLVELSAVIGSNAGAFAVLAPSTAVTGINILFGSRGSTTAVFPSKTSQAASTTPRAVISIGDINSPNAEIRVDDLSAVTVVTTQGSGNYGNYTMYMGRRAGTSNPFNGRMYSMIIRGGASSAVEIANIKKYIKSKAGI